ncbi:MAG: hypothetical protein II781_00855 [Clostridia bacterium]|nr:hypothetical protein [Clostridia bacterium]
MKIPLYSELRTIYETTQDDPHTFRLTFKLKDFIDGGILRHAVDRTMQRFPYFRVRLCQEGANVYFEENPAPVPVLHTRDRISLGGRQANGHLLAFCYWDNRIHLDVYHAMTDGGGIYPLIKTLLHQYCSEYYSLPLAADGVRMPDDPVPPAEWEDPARKPLGSGRGGLTVKWNQPAFQLTDGKIIHPIPRSIVLNVRIPESEFMQFNISNDGSPATIISLILAESIARLHPETEQPIVIAMCVNQRRALAAPLAHQSLVGDVRLVYPDRLRSLPFSRRATIFRGMVALQSDTDMVLDEIRDYQALMRQLDNLKAFGERHDLCVRNMEKLTDCLTGTVSYVGKTDMGIAASYIQEFDCLPSTALPSSHTPLTIEMSAINGYFFINFIQDFLEMDYFNQFILQLREHQINYDVLNRYFAQYPLLEGLDTDVR